MSGWNKCSEHVPMIRQRVIFIDKDKGTMYIGSYRGRGGGGAAMFLAVNRLMTADWWMELPDGPKEEV